MKQKRVVVVGTMGADPWAGMAWMHMQITAGLVRLGHDASYLETTSRWPYDPRRQQMVCDSDYTLPYLAGVLDKFGLGDRWAYRRSYSDKAWLGPRYKEAEDLLAHADVVLNVTGATRFAEEGLKVGPLVYVGTDPVYHEVALSNGDEDAQCILNEHDVCVTYGENIGNPDCPIPPLPRLVAKTRQPVLLDAWVCGPPTRNEYTTVCNWRQDGRDIVFRGERYYWSKHHEFLKFVDLPSRANVSIELAMGLVSPDGKGVALGDPVPAVGMTAEEHALLLARGWKLGDAHAFTKQPWPYRDYVQASRGEFTVAKDQNVRLRSGWFSERSACYLAAGRPVITQDTAFGAVLPTGEGLFAFNTLDEAVDAFEAVESDYDRHSRAAREIADEYFRAETVLARLLEDLGV